LKKTIYVVSPSLFSSKELQQYEEKILDNKNLTETEASKFFVDFPKFLTVGGYKGIAKEVVLYSGSGEYMYRVDFCRQKFGAMYWDVVELKSPNKPFLIKKGKHWDFSSEIHHGIHQALDYRHFLDNDLNCIETEKRSGIKIFQPRILLIGGRKNDNIDSKEILRLTSYFNNVEISSYDDLYNYAKDHYSSSSITVPIIQNKDKSSYNKDVAIKSLREQIRSALLELNFRERRVLELRYGLIDGHPRTVEITAQAFGLKSNQLKQIEAQALRKLRQTTPFKQ